MEQRTGQRTGQRTAEKTVERMRVAAVFALVGSPTLQMAADHLAAIELLRRTGSAIEVVSLQTPNSIPLLPSHLASLNASSVVVEPLAGRCKTTPNFRFAFSYTILRIWSLVDFDRLLYFDGDVAILSSPDEAIRSWAREGTKELRTPTGCNPAPTSTNYNTGVWGITPSSEYISQLEDWLRTGRYPCGIGFQTWANTYGARNSFSRLPVSWNLKADQGVTSCMRRHGLRTAHAVHWSGNAKPHARNSSDDVERQALHAYVSASARWLRLLRLLRSDASD